MRGGRGILLGRQNEEAIPTRIAKRMHMLHKSINA
jgi:hypothetical protein